MKYLISITMVLACSTIVFSQQNLEGRSVGRGMIYTTDQDTIEGQYIVFSKDSLEYYLRNSQTRYALGLNQVTEVQEYNGNYGNTGLWIGGIGGALIGVVVALGTKETKSNLFYKETTIQTWPIYVIGGLSTILGYVIGITIEDWNTIYSRSLALLKNVNIKQNKYNGLAVSYRLYF